MSQFTPANVKAAMRDAGASSSDLWKVPVDKLIVREGFNVRTTEHADYKARVRKIADSILLTGFRQDKPLTGYVTPDGIVLTDGHTRYAAVKLAISEGAEIATLPVVTKAKGTSEEDLHLDLIVGNSGAPLTPYEQAIVCKRLAGFGWTSKDIAAKAGYSSAQYVDGLLLLAGAPLALRKMVMEDVVSAANAIIAIVKYGDKAQDVLLKALVGAAGGRVTAKHLPGAAFKKQLRKSAEPLYIAATKIKADPAYSALSPDIRDMLEKLLSDIVFNQGE